MNLLFKVTLAIVLLMPNHLFSREVLKVAVAGLNHDHVHLLLNLYEQRKVDIVGIAESDEQLVRRMQTRYKIPGNLFYKDLATLLQHVKPTVVLAYNPTNEHVQVAELCMPLKIPVMVEKPLATNTGEAARIAQLAEENATLFLTNYETTWYRSNQRLKALLREQAAGTIRKMMVKDGHEGPKEIGCSEDFLNWLTDPVKNGGGALMDFGCYGANLMTWLKNGERPKAVMAITKQLKPMIYPKVEDDATLVLEYADGSTGIIQASWCWPYSVKDLQVFTTKEQWHAVNGTTLLKYTSHQKPESISLTNAYYENHLAYLEALLKGEVRADDDLSSLNNNVIVVEILEAAKKSAMEGKRVEL
ncbi:Gfo/Idh/MocA family oxidoreductase [Olivibacter sp. LS-1]|uniref:Gfo/Idh/MocA family protein n=1 Tax=Olivibacter sp. LS-1 TaxID=2592345 RepID=UPI0011EB10CF|nr:Gfo/Idh/MocA family oxidoreductase [Olivibacter sp. LS-1]QEL02402.1 Gfo/Idh/MocA family oxidoreductase [Olivibacter sp. LS-1]